MRRTFVIVGATLGRQRRRHDHLVLAAAAVVRAANVTRGAPTGRLMGLADFTDGVVAAVQQSTGVQAGSQVTLLGVSAFIVGVTLGGRLDFLASSLLGHQGAFRADAEDDAASESASLSDAAALLAEARIANSAWILAAVVDASQRITAVVIHLTLDWLRRSGRCAREKRNIRTCYKNIQFKIIFKIRMI
jgi:hypothetical protein